jgi:hypothetical protein
MVGDSSGTGGTGALEASKSRRSRKRTCPAMPPVPLCPPRKRTCPAMPPLLLQLAERFVHLNGDRQVHGNILVVRAGSGGRDLHGHRHRRARGTGGFIFGVGVLPLSCYTGYRAKPALLFRVAESLFGILGVTHVNRDVLTVRPGSGGMHHHFHLRRLARGTSVFIRRQLTRNVQC